MPTIVTHAIVSLPIAKSFFRSKLSKQVLFFSILMALLPDFDGIGYALGIEYDSLFGHRGFSHSILFIIIASGFFTFLITRSNKGQKYKFLFLNFFLIGILHITLDAMTNGGLGVAIFSPFYEQRFFLPWRPIEVSAILPQYFFQLNGLKVLYLEILYLILPSILIYSILKYKENKSPD